MYELEVMNKLYCYGTIILLSMQTPILSQPRTQGFISKPWVRG